MSISKKWSILKLATIFMVVALMAGTFAEPTKSAVAAPATICTTTIPGDLITPAGTDNCTMNIAVVLNTVTGLSFTGSLDVTTTNPAIGTNYFTFTVSVADTRSTTEGWQLQALSTGLTGGPSAIPLYLNVTNSGGTPTTTTTSCSTTGTPPAECGTPTPAASTELVPAATAVTFITDTYTAASNGTTAITVVGSYTIPPATVVPTSYSATLMLSLLNKSA